MRLYLVLQNQYKRQFSVADSVLSLVFSLL